MIYTKRFYLNRIMQSVIEDYDKKIIKMKMNIEEENPIYYELTFKDKVKKIFFNSKYDELRYKIKEYNELKKRI